jgi:endo-1,4-beta-xylanase
MRKPLFLLALVILIILALATAGWKDKQMAEPTLKELAAQKQLQFGAYAARDRLDEAPYRQILAREFNFAVIDGQPNWQFEDGALRPGPDQYDFSRIDEVLKFAQDNHLPVRMHHLVWGEEKWLPDWLKSGDYSKQQLMDMLEHHIAAVGRYYQGKAREWSVVNEAFTRARHEKGLHDWWADHIGSDEFIDKAFQWAHAADPQAVLLLNDFRNEDFGPVSDAMYRKVKQMKSNGVPIDGIGMQMHLDGTRPPQRDSIIKNMRRFGELGVKVYVTEFDVNMSEVRGDRPGKEVKQAAIYHDMLRACLESGVCPSFAILGITDRESWYNELGVKDAMPLIFDRDYRPKPAYYALHKALRE